jgi:predicted helicase
VFVAATIYEILDELRRTSLSEADKGSKFERLVKGYLRADPVWSDQLCDVHLWSEYPGNKGKHDTGIDLVATDRNTGDLVAIQCKFFAPQTTVSKPMIDSFLSASGKEGFKERIIFSTTEKWGANAEDAIRDQAVPVRRVGMSDLENSRIDWGWFSIDKPDELHLAEKKVPREHQRVAIDKVKDGFANHDRGKLIMACGTGKTFTSLKLAEETVGAGGKVLFLVPSISLLSQTVREWVSNADLPLRPLAVCSDPKSTARKTGNDAFEDISVTDLALPATTNVQVFKDRLSDAEADDKAMTVVFATYQSIDIVAKAQKGRSPFDLVVADEAHRTTGTTLAGEDESAFVRVHDNTYLPAAKRVYMTATPRIYDDSSKTKAGEANAILASMDNEELYGPEFHRLGFGEAVELELLTDYKVLVLTVDEESVARTFQQLLSDDGNELKLDDAAKIVGCWNGLAKRGKVEHSFEPDTRPMRRAIAFAGNIKDSKRIEELFQSVTDHYVGATDQENSDGTSPLRCNVQHVDGTMNALERNNKLDWLKDEPTQGSCRILTNARCLSEGVDVPALDAVMFLSPRKSVVDIVQSVGRVMRKDDASGKRFGYIILPIGIPAGMTPEEALKDNKRYAAVWEVLQALRAHDERFDALVNRIALSKTRDTKVNVIGVKDYTDDGEQGALDLIFRDLDAWRDAIYAKVVQKVGSREYWTDWAKDVADIAQRQITRITALLKDPATGVREEFDAFLEGLRGNLNDGITESDAIDMLAQHLITRPVFNALFAGDEFLDNNPVAQTMERMLAVLDQHDLDAENESLQKFYDSVRRKVRDVTDAEGRQKLIVRLYDTFFSTAFKKTVDKLGIVYTPVEIVDFILHSADELLRDQFGQGLTDEGVHILDGFTGTGTFIVRLLQSGLIAPHDLARKYAEELHANEILLLAYYIAAVNIETSYLGLRNEGQVNKTYESFPGLILTDTFQSWEDDDTPDLKVFPENNERLKHLKQLPITVIVGNPPYSAKQDSANDDNANEKYPTLDEAIRSTYAERSTSTNKNSLYDSYIRAIKWATLRIKDRGIIAYVTNGGWIESNTADGMRKTLAEEFSDIYIYNLRGNRRIGGAEGRPIFEAFYKNSGGSITTIAVIVLIKNPEARRTCQLHYAQVGDYTTAIEKVKELTDAGSMFGTDLAVVIPNEHGDWRNQRRDDFGAFQPLTGDGGLFQWVGPGSQSNRDAWVIGFNRSSIEDNITRATEVYERDRSQGRQVVTTDESSIKWTPSLIQRLERGDSLSALDPDIRRELYRPFCMTNLYADARWIHRPGVTRKFAPTAEAQNIGFAVPGAGTSAEFSVLVTNAIPDVHLLANGQFISRWRFEKQTEHLGMFGSDAECVESGHRKMDNVTDVALKTFIAAYGPKVTKDDIFFYVYGLLHSSDYRDIYAADLKKMLPRIPLVEDPSPFINAGRALCELHLAYESATPYPLSGLDAEPTGDPYDYFAVQKMSFAKMRDPATNKLITDRTSIIYNSRVTLNGIPEGTYRYVLGTRSAVEWIIDRYQLKTDQASGIVNDPNDWSRQVGDPRYIVDLLARIVTVSLETMQIVDALPALAVRSEQGAS